MKELKEQMDPISAVFASYLELATQKTTEKLSDALGLEVQTIVVEHQNIQVPYSYQRWKIQYKSICQNHENDIAKLSECTQAAQSLFNDMCSHYRQNTKLDQTQKRLENMYCKAANEYKATTASISWSAQDNKRPKTNTECNLALSRLLIEQSSEARAHKKKVCGNLPSQEQ